jgi:predicted esterase
LSPDEPFEGRIEVARSARYWALGDSESVHADVWFVLHGYGQLARRFVRRFTALAEPSRLIVAPEALSRFYIGSGEGRHGPDAVVGATWMTREDREAEIRDYVAYLDALSAAVLRGGERVTVLGFSQGVATAWRWIALGSIPGLVRLVAWAGTLPPDLDLERARRGLAGAEVLLVSGARDHTIPPAVVEDAAERLGGAGIPFEVVQHGGGHDIREGTLRQIAG